MLSLKWCFLSGHWKHRSKELSIRKTVAAVGRLNDSLPLFPNGKESDKFTPGEILEILEWSIPEV
jgi:hypothetical protein